MLPIAGRPLISYALGTAEKMGAKTVYVVLNRDDAVTATYLREGYEGVAKILVRIQETPQGLADAVYIMRHEIRTSYIVVLADDVTVDNTLREASLLLASRDAIAVECAVREQHSDRIKATCGIEIDSESRITRIVEKPQRGSFTYRGIGVYAFAAPFFEVLRSTAPWRNGEVRLTDALATLVPQRKLYGYPIKGENFNVNTPEDQRLAEKRIVLSGA